MSQNVPQISERKRLANRQNARKSTGPRTDEGKARSSKNAITHGVFCQGVVIVKEDEPLFKALRKEFIRDLKPQRHIELQMVDKIVECTWKQRRLRITESAEYELELREHLREAGQTWEEEMARNDQPDYCAPVAMSRMIEREEGNLEHYTRLDQRLQNMIHRCLKELRTLRESAAETAALPDSPFEETVEEVPCKWGSSVDGVADAVSPDPESPTTPTEESIDAPPTSSDTETQNEPTVGRRFDADVTCDPAFQEEIAVMRR